MGAFFAAGITLGLLIPNPGSFAHPPAGEGFGPPAHSAPAYLTRAHQTEAAQGALKDRTEHFHARLRALLLRAAPDLVAKLDAPPSGRSGYQILPHVLPDRPETPPAKPHVVTYSWGWSDTLLAREETAFDALTERLAAQEGKAPDRTALERLVADYQKALARRKPIDADVDYNRFWQADIARDRPRYDRTTALLDAVAARLERADAKPAAEAAAILAAAGGLHVPSFVRIERPAPHHVVVVVPMYTDIADRTLRESFTAAVEKLWQANDGTDEYRLEIRLTEFTPQGSDPLPRPGDPIDAIAHGRRFPADGAVLTTGASALHVAGGRTIALASHDVAPRALAHELGHLLGFPDLYLRGYRDAGADGFQVLELVPDYTDVMSSPGYGGVLPRHFTALLAAAAR